MTLGDTAEMREVTSKTVKKNRNLDSYSTREEVIDGINSVRKVPAEDINVTAKLIFGR